MKWRAATAAALLAAVVRASLPLVVAAVGEDGPIMRRDTPPVIGAVQSSVHSRSTSPASLALDQGLPHPQGQPMSIMANKMPETVNLSRLISNRSGNGTVAVNESDFRFHFDCTIGLDVWMTNWTQAKKAWCCMMSNGKEGCLDWKQVGNDTSCGLLLANYTAGTYLRLGENFSGAERCKQECDKTPHCNMIVYNETREACHLATTPFMPTECSPEANFKTFWKPYKNALGLAAPEDSAEAMCEEFPWTQAQCDVVGCCAWESGDTGIKAGCYSDIGREPCKANWR